MARFVPRTFFKKIHAYPLMVELYKQHEITALFELTEQSPRKTVVHVLTDFYETLSPEQKIAINEDLTKVFGLATTHALYLFPLLLKKRGISAITTIECTTKEDFALYYFLFYKDDVFEDTLFLHSFFLKPNYMLYETKEVDLTNAEFGLTELTKEYKRILDKESVGKEYATNHAILNKTLYYSLRTKEIGSNKEELLRIVYLYETKEVLISYTGTTYDKHILLDTFLRVICNDGYLDREESYALDRFKKDTFDFAGYTLGTPYISWKIKSVTLTLGSEKTKKTIKLSLPSKQESVGISPLTMFYKELGIEETAALAHFSNVSFSLYFVDEKNKEKSIHVPVSLRENGSNLCPLYPYHAYARKMIKASGIYQGFVDIAKKEKERVTKKWE